MRPSREARLLAPSDRQAQDGPLPKAVVVRLWREIIAGVLRLQGPFSLAVYAPEGANGLLGSGARPFRQPDAGHVPMIRRSRC